MEKIFRNLRSRRYGEVRERRRQFRQMMILEGSRFHVVVHGGDTEVYKPRRQVIEEIRVVRPVGPSEDVEFGQSGRKTNEHLVVAKLFVWGD